jgi:DNA-binding transcriptional LysR family regulator
MDARQLEYFLSVVDHDGFGRAAAKLHIAQPSLSQAIAALERDLGVRLFHRLGRGVVLSDAGAELIEPARQVLRDLATARATMDSTKGLRRGRVEMVSMPSPGIEPLGTLTRVFSRRHPGLSIRVDAAFTATEVVERVRQGAAELGLAGAPEVLRSPGVNVLPLEAQDFVLVEPPDDESSAGSDDEPVSRADLAGARAIVTPEDSVMRRIVDDVLAEGTDIRVVAEVAHRTSILPLVLQGVGLAILPESWASLARRTGARVRRLAPAPQLHVALVSRVAPLTPAARAFLAVAESYAATRTRSEQAR